ncbi:ATP-dependent RNA helicase RhlE [Mucilaginibacter mallensis]|uniref:ATP-dependent RNA helicase RhlE n=1 Tax=Mucilaginibacter mallensis TaxID=652787 RepID=A0A1H2A1Q0_MUCMA|nr:DEAD/DEAH box helicase [Mucilaginibacter mallensis]SDT39941.1 ATP-dependent RNA helicase RhlE [Mucilaginibacter mallensis]
MVWLDKFKLNKGLSRTLTEAGYLNPKEIQLKTLSRIIGGQDVIAVAPEGSGKTTTYIIGILNRITRGYDDAPRVLILVPDKERVEAVMQQFDQLKRNDTIQIVGLYVTPGIEAQMNALADGADIVVATPDRARAIYLKLGLNLNKIDVLIVDDAEDMVKQGLQLPVAELANSITKSQHLVFTEVLHAKLHKMIDPFMKMPAIVEAEELEAIPLNTHQQLLYNVPNFRTKLNLLNLFMQDDELFTKTVVFVNTRVTAETVQKSLKHRMRESVVTINPLSYESKSVQDVAEFKQDDTLKVLIIANENADELDLSGIPFLIHLDVPEEKELFINRIVNNGDDDDTLAITFSTDIELALVKKIEQASGKKMPLAALPDELVIDTDKKEKEAPAEKPAAKSKKTEPVAGEAFHEKKAANSKTYNYSSGTKAKMNNKRKH